MKKIGVFDSGIGGASVLTEMLKAMPNEDYLFLSDSANNPYGEKSPEELYTICKYNVDYLLSRNVKCIVIACNTASTQMANRLREEYKDTLIFAIEPAYKMVYDYAYDEPTLILATQGTIKSEQFHLLYSKYNNHKTEIIPCIGLADAIEDGDEKRIDEILNKYLSPYTKKVKNVVIGCTHYPFVKNRIVEQLGGDIKFFYGAEALTKHIKEELDSRNMLETVEKDRDLSKDVEFVDTSNSEFKKKRFYEIISHYETEYNI